MKTVKQALLGLSFLLAPISAAHAATLSADELLQQYNVITKGDFINRSDDIEGNAYIGGNLTSGNIFEFGAHDANPRADVAELVVQGNVENSISIIRGGNASRDVFIGGTSNVKFEGSAVQNIDSIFVPENVTQTLDDLALQLSGLSANTTAGRSSNRLTLNANGANDGVAVFDLTFGDLNLGEIDAILGDATLVILNVTGDGRVATNFLGNALPFGTKAIWNFSDATDIVFERTFVGQILAGNATVENRGNIEGSLFANTFIQGAQAHLNSFSGTLIPTTPVAPVPLPASLGFLLSGAALLAGLRKRKS